MAVGRRYKVLENSQELEEVEETEEENKTETILQALQACRAKNTDWYAVSYCGATKQEILDIAGYVETAYPSCVQFFTTEDSDTIEGVEGKKSGEKFRFCLTNQKTYYTILLNSIYK